MCVNESEEYSSREVCEGLKMLKCGRDWKEAGERKERDKGTKGTKRLSD
jgi:hypothetical protein